MYLLRIVLQLYYTTGTSEGKKGEALAELVTGDTSMTKNKKKTAITKRRTSNEDAIFNLFDEMSVIRVRDVINAGIHPETLRRMRRRGSVVRVSRGLYVKAGATPTPHQALIEVLKKSPRGVACLLTALRFHEVGTQSPREVWIALPRGSRVPKMPYPRLRTFRFSGIAYTSGIQVHRVGGIELRVYNVAKTIADCFKYRNKIGTNIAVEALRDALRDKKCTPDELWRYATICRVTRIIQPYLEAVV